MKNSQSIQQIQQNRRSLLKPPFLQQQRLPTTRFISFSLGSELKEGIQPKLIHSLHKAAYYNRVQLRPLSELCGSGFTEAQNKLKQIQHHFSRPGIVLLLEKD